MPKQQILLIHGGMTFKKRADYLDYLQKRTLSLEKIRKWSAEYLDKKLGAKFEIIRPSMPLREFANYEDWKIHFERHFAFLRHGAILIGSSLGGIFLAKYLSENKFPGTLKAVFFVAPPYDDSLGGERLAGGFKLKKDLTLLEKNCDNVILFFSGDDPVVPIRHAELYRRALPKAKIVIYTSKNGHFFVPSFPELVKMIQLASKK